MIKLPNMQKGFPAAGVVHNTDSLKRGVLKRVLAQSIIMSRSPRKQ